MERHDSLSVPSTRASMSLKTCLACSAKFDMGVFYTIDLTLSERCVTINFSEEGCCVIFGI